MYRALYRTTTSFRSLSITTQSAYKSRNLPRRIENSLTVGGPRSPPRLLGPDRHVGTLKKYNNRVGFIVPEEGLPVVYVDGNLQDAFERPADNIDYSIPNQEVEYSLHIDENTGERKAKMICRKGGYPLDLGGEFPNVELGKFKTIAKKQWAVFSNDQKIVYFYYDGKIRLLPYSDSFRERHSIPIEHKRVPALIDIELDTEAKWTGLQQKMSITKVDSLPGSDLVAKNHGGRERIMTNAELQLRSTKFQRFAYFLKMMSTTPDEQKAQKVKYSVKLEQQAKRKEAEMKELLKRNLVKPTKLQLLMDKMDAEARKMPRPASASL